MSTTEQKPIEEMTVAELREELGKAGIDAPSGTKKELLVRLVETARADRKAPPKPAEAEPEEAPAAPADDAGAESGDAAEPEQDADAEPEPTAEDVAAAESQALALREEAVVHAPALLPTTAEFFAMREMAEAVARTQMVPTAYRGKPDDVLAAILTGREMGLGPMQSLRDIFVIDGKPALAAHLLMAQMRKGGIVVLDKVSTAERAWVKLKRLDTGEISEVEYTMEEAELITYRKKGGSTARLVDKDNWVSYPKDMLWARLVGRIARQVGPDLVGAAMPFSSEEVQDWDTYEEQNQQYGADKKAGKWQGPTSWQEFGQRFAETVGDAAASEWLGELAVKGYAHETIGGVVSDPETTDERKSDLWRRLLRVLEALESEGECQIRPDAREVVQKAFAAAFDGLAIDGPDWALTGAEAEAGRPQFDSSSDDAGAAESPSAVEDAPAEPDAASDAAEAEDAEWTPVEGEYADEPPAAPPAAPDAEPPSELDDIPF